MPTLYNETKEKAVYEKSDQNKLINTQTDRMEVIRTASSESGQYYK